MVPVPFADYLLTCQLRMMEMVSSLCFQDSLHSAQREKDMLVRSFDSHFSREHQRKQF